MDKLAKLAQNWVLLCDMLHLNYDKADPRAVAEENKNIRESLRDMIANARLLKQCPEYDGCDICKAERLVP